MPRQDVIAALKVLADRDLHASWERGERTWPHLDDAIHWLIDDTGLDVRPVTTAADDVSLFETDEEAQLVQNAVNRVLALIDELGDVSADRYVHHAEWLAVVDDCCRAHLALTLNR